MQLTVHRTKAIKASSHCKAAAQSSQQHHLWDDLQDLVDLLLKVHVQQAVCFVQNQVLQLPQREPLQAKRR